MRRLVLPYSSREFCAAVVLPKSKIFLISDDSELFVHDERTFDLVDKIQVPLITSQTDDKIFLLTENRDHQYRSQS